MALIDVTVPDIGDFKDVPVIEILVKPGDEVKADEPSDDAGKRQGDDGSAGPRRGKVVEIVRQGRRQGVGKAR